METELQKLAMRRVTVIPLVIITLRALTTRFKKYIGEILTDKRAE